LNYSLIVYQPLKSQPMSRPQMCYESCKQHSQILELSHRSCEASPQGQARVMTKFSRWAMAAL
jgi:hypothetical protein